MSQVQNFGAHSVSPTGAIMTINLNPPDGTGNYTLLGANGLFFTQGLNESTINTLSGAFAYNTVAGVSQAAVAGNAYVLTNVSMTTVSLPANAGTNVGDTIKIIGLSGGYTISQAANQQITIGNDSSTVGIGGNVACAGSAFNAIELTCVNVTGTYIWATIIPPQGTFTTT